VILVRLNKTWPMVFEETHPAIRETLAKFYTCYAWPMRPAELAALPAYADVLLGIHRGNVVTACDDLTWRRPAQYRPPPPSPRGMPSGGPRLCRKGAPAQACSFTQKGGQDGRL
jgi:hypothetical protein